MSVKTVNKQNYQTMSCQEQTPKKLRKKSLALILRFFGIIVHFKFM